MSRILLVEDDPAVREVVALALQQEHHHVDAAGTGRLGLERFASDRPELVLLDVMLPEVNGIEVCRQIRRDDASTPILLMSARTDPIDVVVGLESGADDYITKPFEIRVLMARVHAALRRLQPITDGGSHLSIGSLEVDTAAKQASLDGTPLDLTATEFRLLVALARHPGQVMGRDALLRDVWDYDYLGDSRIVDVGIGRLRAKLGDDPRDPALVRTRRGFGYYLARP